MTGGGYPRRLWAMTAAGAAGAALVFASRRVLRVEVHGGSMAPTLRPGDRMVAIAGLPGRTGDIVAVRDPRLPSRLLVKRVEGVEADLRLRLAGDEPSASTDSRSFGPVPPALVAGRVVWRYWPGPRRGLLGQGRPLGASMGFR